MLWEVSFESELIKFHSASLLSPIIKSDGTSNETDPRIGSALYSSDMDKSNVSVLTDPLIFVILSFYDTVDNRPDVFYLAFDNITGF